MNKKLIAKLMCSRRNPLVNSGAYFFRADFDYVLQGLCFEYAPRGVYISKFLFPLFDSAGLNLTFSERLLQQKGFVAKGSMTEQGIVDFAMNSPEAGAVFDPVESIGLSGFINGIESLPYDWRSTRVALIYAEALILNGQPALAANILDGLASIAVLSANDLLTCNHVMGKLKEDSKSACAMLDQVRQENLKTLRLTK